VSLKKKIIKFGIWNWNRKEKEEGETTFFGSDFCFCLLAFGFGAKKSSAESLSALDFKTTAPSGSSPVI